MGAAFLLEKKKNNKHFIFSIGNFFPHFSSEHLLSLPPWSVSVLQNVFPLSEIITGCLNSTAN